MQRPHCYLLVFFCFLLNLSKAWTQEGFVPNLGQWEGAFEYKAMIQSGNVFLGKQDITWILYDSDSLSKLHHQQSTLTRLPVQVVKARFLGANPNSKSTAKRGSESYYNYYLSSDKKNWKSGLKAYAEVYYEDIYSNIDLQIFFHAKGVKYNFIVKPGGNPEQIKIQYEGAENLQLNARGLEITTSFGKIIEYPPYVYQSYGNAEHEIKTDFELNGNIISFKVQSRFKKRYALVIDPILVFSTFSGSHADNFGFTATYDLDENGYAAGTVYNFNFNDTAGFPVTPGAYQLFFRGGVDERPSGFSYPSRDCGIHKYSQDGSQLLYGTFLGASHNEQPHSLIVNSKNELLVFGSTRSKDFPTTSIFLSTPNPTNVFDYNIFISKFSVDGTALLSSVLIGGEANDGVNGDLLQLRVQDHPLLNNYADEFRGEVIVDELDNVYVATSTNSILFPNSSGNPDPLVYQPPQSGLILKFSPNLNELMWRRIIGGLGYDACFGIALGTEGDIFVAGGTTNSQFFSNLNGHRTGITGNAPDGFLVRVNRETAQIMSGTLVGTSSYDQCYMVKTDTEGFPYVYGQTRGNFPVIGNVYSTPGGASQFIAKYNKGLNQILLSTTIGSGRPNVDISPTAFLVDVCGKIYVAGWGGASNSSSAGFLGGNTSNMPITIDAFQKTTDSSDVWFAVLEKNMESLIYASYFGGRTQFGNTAQEHVDGGTSRFDARGVMYHSVCAGCGKNSLFPTTDGAFSRLNKSENCNNALFKFNIDAQNKKPIVKDTFYTVQITDTLRFTYFGTDPDKKDEISLEFYGELLDSNNKGNKPIIHSSPSTDTVWASVFWIPQCIHLTGDTFQLKVMIKDKGCPHSDSAFAIIKIVVTAPPLAMGPEMLCIDFFDLEKTKIQWDPFPINRSFKSANILRVSPNGTIQNIKTLTNGSGGFFFEDTNLNLRNEDYCYFVVTENICGQTDTLSYRICSKKQFETPILGNELITVTVPDNKRVKLIWSKSEEDDFKSYRIYKSKNNPQLAWEYQTDVTELNDTFWFDNNVDVSKNSFCYSMQIADKCGNVSDTSEIGCNIVLKGISERWYFDVDWNPYRKWQSGVEEYVLKRRVDTGSLRPLVRLPENKLNWRDDDLDYNWGGYFFQVQAQKRMNGLERYEAISESNIIYLFQPPLLHVPTGFSPNADNKNDVWGFVPVFVKDFHIRVYNRWGELVFDTKNKHQQWDGSYQNEIAWDNAFVWMVTYTGWDQRVYSQKGTVTILR